MDLYELKVKFCRIIIGVFIIAFVSSFPYGLSLQLNETRCLEGCLCGCGFVNLECIDVYDCFCSGSQLVLKVEPNLKKKHQYQEIKLVRKTISRLIGCGNNQVSFK